MHNVCIMYTVNKQTYMYVYIHICMYIYIYIHIVISMIRFGLRDSQPAGRTRLRARSIIYIDITYRDITRYDMIRHSICICTYMLS